MTKINKWELTTHRWKHWIHYLSQRGWFCRNSGKDYDNGGLFQRIIHDFFLDKWGKMKVKLDND